MKQRRVKLRREQDGEGKKTLVRRGNTLVPHSLNPEGCQRESERERQSHHLHKNEMVGVREREEKNRVERERRVEAADQVADRERGCTSESV